MRDPNKAQRTLGLVTDVPRDRRSLRAEWSGSYEGTLEERLLQAERDVRRLSRLQIDEQEEALEEQASIEEAEQTRREKPESATSDWIEIAIEKEIEQRRETLRLSKAQVEIPMLESPEELTPPQEFTQPQPQTVEVETKHHRQESLLTPPLHQFARPDSAASSYRSGRRNTKIASSRGLRASSYPNFSRPIAQTPIPGEDMERDPLHIRFNDDDMGPLSPVSPVGGLVVADEVKAARMRVEEARVKMILQASKEKVEEENKPKLKTHRPKKARWSSLPISLMKFGKRSSRGEEENVKHKREVERLTLTEENLQRWEDNVGYVPKMHRMGYDLLRSPVEVDMEVQQGTPAPSTMQLPHLPKLHNLTLTPPASPPLAPPPRTSSLAVTAHAHPTLPSAAGSSKPRPHRQPTLAAQKEIAAGSSSSTHVRCAICKEAEHPSTFPARQITSKCKHPTQTCLECMKSWIETCVETRGWDRCTCPECGEYMAYNDVRAFATQDGFLR